MGNLSYENVFHLQVHFHANQTHFHIKGFEPNLVLKEAQGNSKLACYDLLFSILQLFIIPSVCPQSLHKLSL